MKEDKTQDKWIKMSVTFEFYKVVQIIMNNEIMKQSRDKLDC